MKGPYQKKKKHMGGTNNDKTNKTNEKIKKGCQSILDTTWRDHIEKQKQQYEINIGKTTNTTNKNKLIFKLVWLRGPMARLVWKSLLCLCLFVVFSWKLFAFCIAALRCAAALRSAPLRCAVLRCAALHCAALSFGVLARTPLSPELELNGGLANKGEIWEVHSGSRKCNPL